MLFDNDSIPENAYERMSPHQRDHNFQMHVGVDHYASQFVPGKVVA